MDEIDDRCSVTPTSGMTIRPSVARVYDYLMGGDRNFPADQAVANQVLAHMPGLPGILRANRDFLRRVVTHLAGIGIRQFIDLGCGIPTPDGNVHQVAHRIDPSIRVAYVDLDPVAVETADEMLAGAANTRVVQADLRDPTGVLDHPQIRGLLDLTRPVAVLMLSVLHLVPDTDRPDLVLHALYRALPAGSYLAVSHMSPPERQTPPGAGDAAGIHARSGTPFHPRTLPELEALLGNWQLLPPGLVACPHWRPDAQTPPLDLSVTFPGYAALSHKAAPPRQEERARVAVPSAHMPGRRSRSDR